MGAGRQARPRRHRSRARRRRSAGAAPDSPAPARRWTSTSFPPGDTTTGCTARSKTAARGPRRTRGRAGGRRLSRHFYRGLAFLEAERRGRLAKATAAERRTPPPAPARPRPRLARRARGRAAPALVPPERAGGHGAPSRRHAGRRCRAVGAQRAPPRQPPPPGVDVRRRRHLSGVAAAHADSRAERAVALLLVPGDRAFPLVAGRPPRTPARQVDARGVGPAGGTAAPAGHEAGRSGGARARGRVAPESAASGPVPRADGARRPVIYSRRLTLRELAGASRVPARRRRFDRDRARRDARGRRARRPLVPRRTRNTRPRWRRRGPRRSSSATTRRRRRARCCGRGIPTWRSRARPRLLAPDDRPAPGRVAVAPASTRARSSAPAATSAAFASVGRRRRHRGAHRRPPARGRSTPASTIGDDCADPRRTPRSASGARSGTASSSRTAPSIGSDGFGFAPRPDGTYQKIPQAAPVVIEDDVEIGANTTIDRPAVGETRIEAGTKIDNLVHGGARRPRRPQRDARGPGGHRGQHDDRRLGRSSPARSGVAGHLHIGKGTQGHGADRDSQLAAGRVVRARATRRSTTATGSSRPAVFRRLPEMQEGPGRPREAPRRPRGQARRRVPNAPRE
ncbi:MAG: hypothetical protein MZV64_28230 [Ignavibacteriales bacterium]|nr:hypothetical protein [Ignavibacteriales bacterium]